MNKYSEKSLTLVKKEIKTLMAQLSSGDSVGKMINGVAGKMLDNLKDDQLTFVIDYVLDFAAKILEAEGTDNGTDE